MLKGTFFVCLSLLLFAASATVSNIYSDGEKLDIGIKLCRSDSRRECKDVFFGKKNYTYSGKTMPFFIYVVILIVLYLLYD